MFRWAEPLAGNSAQMLATKCGHQDRSAGCYKPRSSSPSLSDPQRSSSKDSPMIPWGNAQVSLLGSVPQSWGSWVITLSSVFPLEKPNVQGVPLCDGTVLLLSFQCGPFQFLWFQRLFFSLTLGSGIFTGMSCLWTAAMMVVFLWGQLKSETTYGITLMMSPLKTPGPWLRGARVRSQTALGLWGKGDCFQVL